MKGVGEGRVVGKGGEYKNGGVSANARVDKSLPKKRLYRARAHSNPQSDSQFPVPVSPDAVDWSEHFPSFFKSHTDQSVVSESEEAGGGEGGPVQNDGVVGGTRKCRQSQLEVKFADVGCGFGGLLVKLSPMYPDTLMVGMELRDKVSEYVKERISALRVQNPGSFENISVVRTNAMKYLPNYYRKGQLTKMFFLFPDPHFKEKNHRRRIINQGLLAEYAYFMSVGGVLYTVTDVEELGDWMQSNLDEHPLFERLSEEEMAKDDVAVLLTNVTEEGQKVERNEGQTFCTAHRRIAPPASHGASA